jgi:hypothetical protein
MSHAIGWVTIVSVCGSHTAAWKFVSVATFPEPATISTLPLFIKAR